MVTQTAQRQLTPVSFTQITFDDPFWAPRQAINRTVTIPHMYHMCMESGRIGAFDLNFTRPVPSPIVLIFGDSDVAKWLEAACYALANVQRSSLRSDNLQRSSLRSDTGGEDAELAAQIDQVADKIIRAQQPDGYLNTHFTVAQPEMRWKNLRDWHELYCAGHLMEAAVAHHQLTGDPKLLHALSRYADHIDATFGPEPEKAQGYGGHPEIELALVRLYRATDEPRYLRLAHYFVEERGRQPHYYDLEASARGEDVAAYRAGTYEYCQAHAPIREQDKVVGHAVRAMYLYAGVVDLAHELGDSTLLAACERLWENLVNRRMYLTGGIGPSRHNEGFTQDYDLPDESAYAETCAAIALILWNHRLLQTAGKGAYADIIEQTLYNGFISGVSLDGKHFFYDNPLASAGNHHRVPWFACPCCPPNLARLLASLGNYVYSTGPDSLWVHLYAQSKATFNLDDQTLHIRQATQYPWDGRITLTLDMDRPLHFALRLRIPGWCEQWQVRINHTASPATPGAETDQVAEQTEPVDGYLSLARTWQPGDQIELTLEMPVQVVWANPAVRQLQGRVALQRGPIVYCLEGVDHGTDHGTDHNNLGLDRISIDPEAAAHFTAEHSPELLGGVTVLRGTGTLIDNRDWDDRLYRRKQPPATRPVAVTAVPYAVWDNRAPGEMRVWLRANI